LGPHQHVGGLLDLTGDEDGPKNKPRIKRSPMVR
jgi:hypothetical protein